MSSHAKEITKFKDNIPKLSELLELTSNNISDDLIINLEIKSTPVEDNLTPPPDVMASLIVDEVNKTNKVEITINILIKFDR